jgi:hypothetical protein
MLELGTAVVIWWAGSEFHKCEGLLQAKEKESERVTLTLIVNVVCPDGTKYAYIAGIPESRLTRSGN